MARGVTRLQERPKAGGTSQMVEALRAAGMEPQSWQFDPQQVLNLFVGEQPSTVHPGTSGLDYLTLLRMSRVSLISAVIGLRTQQVAEFAVEQPDKYTAGYRVRLRDLEKQMTPAAKRRAREIATLLEDAGGKWGTGLGFEGFVRAFMRDSLTYDQACAEKIRTKAGQLVGFVDTDAATIRKARVTDEERRDGRRDPERVPAYVQFIDNRVTAEYAAEDLIFGIRRPRTWIYANGYGFPEADELVRTVTDLVNAVTYNSVSFTNGVHISTILALQSAMDEESFQAFKRQVVSMMSGVRNAKRTPIVQLNPELKETLQAVNLAQTNRDMEYMQFIGFLMKLVCAVFLCDPAELGFVFGTENQRSAIQSGGPEERIVASKERGLRPMLRSLATWLNRGIIWELEPDFTLEFVGLGSTDEDTRMRLDTEAVRHFKTINEIRTEHDLQPLETPIADMILDPTYIGQLVSMQMQSQQGQTPGEPTDEERGGYVGPDDEEGGGRGQDEAPGSTEEEPFDLDKWTTGLVGAAEKAIDAKTMFWKGGKHAPGKRYYPRRGPGRRAVIVEV